MHRLQIFLNYITSIASYSATRTTRIILHALTSDIATSLDHAIADKQEGGDCDDEMKLHFLTGELWHKEDRMIMKEFLQGFIGISEKETSSNKRQKVKRLRRFPLDKANI